MHLLNAVAAAALCCVAASCTTSDEKASEVSDVSASTSSGHDAAAETTVAMRDETTSSTSEEASISAACGLAVGVSFRESAPRDSITILNEATSRRPITAIEIDLTSSVGSIIFDTVEGGTGVEVFQDFRVEGGEAVLNEEPVAEDGGTALRLEFASFLPAQSFTFSIDVDDQLVDSELGQIQVTGAEIDGATVAIETADGAPVQATFDRTNTAAFVADC